MNDLQKMIRDLRKKSRRPERKDLISVWTEKDRLRGEVVDSFVIILRTRGCRWAYHSGCSMCGYFNDTNPKIEKEDLLLQLEDAKRKYNGEKLVKIFTSGSFLDDWEVPPDVQKKFYEYFHLQKQ